MWDYDLNHSCPGYNLSWIETGEATRLNYTGNWYFWAYCLPGHGYQEVWQGQVPSGDYGQYMRYLVNQSGGTYSISMFNVPGGYQEWYGSVPSYSTVVNDLQVGLETTTNSYSVTHSDEASVTSNEWEGYPNGGWHYQTNGGSGITEDIPPEFEWQYYPSNGYPGGLGFTACC